MKILILLTVGLAAVTAVPFNLDRIVGGTVTDITSYPFGAAVTYGFYGTFRQGCGAAIINSRSALSAAHCFLFGGPENWRLRVGSTYANSGGVVHNTQRAVNHHLFDRVTLDNDITVIRVITPFTFTDRVRAGAIAGPNYNLRDNEPVWAIGWGTIYHEGPLSEQLRHVQVWVVNQEICRRNYAEIGLTVTDNMLCSGWLNVGGRDQCQGDSGSPLLHQNVIVGVCSWGEGCALPRFPGVNARVSRYTAWIQSLA